jgi:hypothetical protein
MISMAALIDKGGALVAVGDVGLRNVGFDVGLRVVGLAVLAYSWLVRW